MSLETWKAKHYPIPASECPKGSAAQHSLTKWRGLSLTVLNKHDLVHGDDYGEDCIVDPQTGRRLKIDDLSCALCRHFYDKIAPSRTACQTCQLAIVRGGVPCIGVRNDETRSPYRAWLDSGDPAPMIRWLKKAVALERKQATTKGGGA